MCKAWKRERKKKIRQSKIKASLINLFAREMVRINFDSVCLMLAAFDAADRDINSIQLLKLQFFPLSLLSKIHSRVRKKILVRGHFSPFWHFSPRSNIIRTNKSETVSSIGLRSGQSERKKERNLARDNRKSVNLQLFIAFIHFVRQLKTTLSARCTHKLFCFFTLFNLACGLVCWRVA